MEEGSNAVRRWEDLDKDCLVKIFQTFHILEVISGIGHVCCSWRSACCDPLLWKTLDLSILKPTACQIPFQPYVYEDGPSDTNLIRVLMICLSLSRGNIRTLIFNVTSYIGDDLLSYTAERCSTLRRLVLPAWNRKNLSGICNAIRYWKDLESLTMPCFTNPQLIMEEISQNCKNFRELKVMGPFDITFASALSTYLPELKVLSLRCSKLYKEALILVLDGLPNLQVLKISHCVLLETPLPPEPAERIIVTQLDKSILEKASRLREFRICLDDSCITCQRTKDNQGLERWWYGYEDNIWQAGAVHSRTV